MNGYSWNGYYECSYCGITFRKYLTDQKQCPACLPNPRSAFAPITPPARTYPLEEAYRNISRTLGEEIIVGSSTTTPAPKKKCTCNWDGPTGVYAIGCKCGGV